MSFVTKPKSSYYLYNMKEEELARTRGAAGEEILASTTLPADARKDFDIRDFMKHYSREQQTRDRNIHSTTSSNKLTLAYL